MLLLGWYSGLITKKGKIMEATNCITEVFGEEMSAWYNKKGTLVYVCDWSEGYDLLEALGIEVASFEVDEDWLESVDGDMPLKLADVKIL